jgi:hypothetical protein
MARKIAIEVAILSGLSRPAISIGQSEIAIVEVRIPKKSFAIRKGGEVKAYPDKQSETAVSG